MNAAVLILVTVLAGLILLFAIISVPLQANRRGQGFTAWILLGIVSLNPFYPMLLVSLLPNKARSRLREKFAAELDEKLAPAIGTSSDLIARKSSIDQSIGDLQTTDPIARSIGDVETQATTDPKRI